jgi:hypothetical protein
LPDFLKKKDGDGESEYVTLTEFVGYVENMDEVQTRIIHRGNPSGGALSPRWAVDSG